LDDEDDDEYDGEDDEFNEGEDEARVPYVIFLLEIRLINVFWLGEMI